MYKKHNTITKLVEKSIECFEKRSREGLTVVNGCTDKKEKCVLYVPE